MSRLELVRTFLFRCRHGFRGAPVRVYGESFRLDESLRRWQAAGEEWMLEMMHSLLRRGDAVIDIGANFGLHTLFAARLVGDNGRVVAFEPIPQNLRLLRRNLRLNHVENQVTIAPQALSDSGEAHLEMHFRPGELDQTASLRPGQGSNQTIRVSNSRLDEYPFPARFSPRLIKIDVEGAELSVLRGARETLMRFHPLLLLEVHGFALPAFGDSVATLEDFLGETGYQRIASRPINMGRQDHFHALYQSPPTAPN